MATTDHRRKIPHTNLTGGGSGIAVVFIRSRAMDEKPKWWRKQHLLLFSRDQSGYQLSSRPHEFAFRLSPSNGCTHSNAKAVANELCVRSLSCGDRLKPRGTNRLAKNNSRHPCQRPEAACSKFFQQHFSETCRPYQKNLFFHHSGVPEKVIRK